MRRLFHFLLLTVLALSVWAVIIFIFLSLFSPGLVRASEAPPIASPQLCPAGAPVCRILVLTPEEEKILTQVNGILGTAAAARALELSASVQYFFLKIQNAPLGTPQPVEKALPPTPAVSPLRK